MVSKDDVQKYLDVGIAFTNLTRAKAEGLVEELITNSSLPRGEARAKVDHLIERGRKGSELVVTQVAHQLSALGITSVEDLAREVSTLISRTADAGKSATHKAAHPKAPDDGADGTAKGKAAEGGVGEPPAGEHPTSTTSTHKRPATTSAKSAGAKTTTAKPAEAKRTPTKSAAAKQTTKKPASSTKKSASAGSAGEPGASD
jgi:polyhydroxyalkanoate synthesis regulator phasin